ncbi:MAG: CRISPR-associated endonuclease Cas1 [Desulfobacula sp.]|nr:CRISPR-associated endonuclease Cas1 [Desulfobacula sp.]
MDRISPIYHLNALLSFVYTLLTNEVLSAINVCGMAPTFTGHFWHPMRR